MCKLLKGFTLSEILIVLLIIGVVSSLVIPALINNTDEAELTVALKKANSVLGNALDMIQANTGGFVSAGIGEYAEIDYKLRDQFCNAMICTKIDTAANVFGPTNYKYYKGGNTDWPGTGEYSPAAVMNNGYFIKFNSLKDCKQFGINACGYIWVDINGKRGPNMIGKDFHNFYISYKNGAYVIIPAGVDADPPALTEGCQKGSIEWKTSDGCTAKRLLDPDHMP